MANSLQTAAPIPVAAPVTNATFSDMSDSFVFVVRGHPSKLLTLRGLVWGSYKQMFPFI
jgi:hypothetical protein